MQIDYNLIVGISGIIIGAILGTIFTWWSISQSRRKGDMFSIVPKTPSRRSIFDVPSLGKRIARKEILEEIRESREQA